MTMRRTAITLLLLAGSVFRLPAQDKPRYDPYHAHKDVEVARFYLRKGDLDAAINRLLEAAQLMPSYAEPRRMLGEAYERKGDTENALKYYREYLKVYPHAPDSAKVKKKITKLERELSK